MLDRIVIELGMSINIPVMLVELGKKTGELIFSFCVLHVIITYLKMIFYARIYWVKQGLAACNIL